VAQAGCGAAAGPDAIAVTPGPGAHRVGSDAGDVAFATLFGPVRTRLIRPEVEQVRARRARR
jgi:hypothetical protein